MQSSPVHTDKLRIELQREGNSGYSDTLPWQVWYCLALEGVEPTARVAVRWYLTAGQACLSLQRSLIWQNPTSKVGPEALPRKGVGHLTLNPTHKRLTSPSFRGSQKVAATPTPSCGFSKPGKISRPVWKSGLLWQVIRSQHSSAGQSDATAQIGQPGA